MYTITPTCVTWRLTSLPRNSCVIAAMICLFNRWWRQSLIKINKCLNRRLSCCFSNISQLKVNLPTAYDMGEIGPELDSCKYIMVTLFWLHNYATTQANVWHLCLSPISWSVVPLTHHTDLHQKKPSGCWMCFLLLKSLFPGLVCAITCCYIPIVELSSYTWCLRSIRWSAFEVKVQLWTNNLLTFIRGRSWLIGFYDLLAKSA